MYEKEGKERAPMTALHALMSSLHAPMNALHALLSVLHGFKKH